MKRPTAFLSILLLVILITAAGCTQGGETSPAPAVPPAPSPASLALTAADAPVNYTLKESRAKTAEEVGRLAKNLGWEGGYVVTYSGYPEEPMGETVISQTITTYPAARLPEILSMVRESDRGDRELIISDLPDPGLGDDSFAFAGKASSQILLRPKTGSPLEGRTLEGSFKQDIVEIVFIRGSTFEVLKMTGPRADYAVLEPLARKAAAQVP
jgi:hypothetical protein